jgi:hypothetical protein
VEKGPSGKYVGTVSSAGFDKSVSITGDGIVDLEWKK